MADNSMTENQNVSARILKDDAILSEWNLNCKGDLPDLISNIKNIKESVNVFLTDLIETKSDTNDNSGLKCGEMDEDDDDDDAEEEEVNILSELMKDVKSGQTSKEFSGSDTVTNNRTRKAKRLKK